MAMDEKGLGRRLQAARVAAGFTQQTLCQQAGLSYSTLTKIERGAIKAPSIFTIQSIAAALGVDLGELLGQPTASRAPKQVSKSGIRFVYFDVNGCLVRFFHHAFTRLAEESGATPDMIEMSFWHYNDAVCRGEMSMDDFDKALAHDLHLPSVDWQSYYLEAIEPILAMHELLRWANEHYYVGLLTNIMPGFLKVMREQSLLPDIAYDVIIDSSEVKAIKPEEAIYTIATERTNRKGSEILLIDDSRTNLMAAQRHDWHVLWFDDYRPDESVARVREALEFAT
jgi:FMN phosphatase YigB (HAD superfamily)/DNA-binding XRE family transcriptional regulator